MSLPPQILELLLAGPRVDPLPHLMPGLGSRRRIGERVELDVGLEPLDVLLRRRDLESARRTSGQRGLGRRRGRRRASGGRRGECGQEEEEEEGGGGESKEKERWDRDNATCGLR